MNNLKPITEKLDQFDTESIDPHEEQIKIAKEFLGECRRTKWVREDISPEAALVAEAMIEWVGDRYIGRISVSAIIAAASELEILCVPQGEREADTVLGINLSDVCAHAATATTTPIAPEQPDNFYRKYAAEYGYGDDAGEPIQFMEAVMPPSPREYAVPDRIPLRQVTMLSGAGGIGKSVLTLQLLVSTVLARDWIGSMPTPGPAIYLGSEDEADEIQNRLDAIAAHYDEPLSDVMGNGLYASSFAGRDMSLAQFTRKGKMEPTNLYNHLFEQARDLKPTVVALDTLSDVFSGDENNRNQVSLFVGLLRSLAMESNCAVIICSHPSQQGTHSGAGTSGSTAWHGKVRGRMYLRAANKDEGDPNLRVLEFLKNQYGQLAPKVVLRYRNGVFVPEMRGGSVDPQVTEQRAGEVFLNLLARFTASGRNVTDKTGTSYAPALFAREREAKAVNLNSKALATAMLALFHEGRIRMVIDGPPSKPRSRMVAVDGFRP